MIASFNSRDLKRFWTRNDRSGIRPDWRVKVQIILDRLDVITTPGQMDLPGFGFHALSGDLAGTYSVFVSRNWRITFGWESDAAVDVDLEDYHGR